MLYNNIITKIYYPKSINNQPIYKKLNYKNNCKNAEIASNRVISLPIYPDLTEKMQDIIIEKIKKYKNK